MSLPGNSLAESSWGKAATLVFPYLKPYRAKLALGVFCLFVAVGMRILEPWPLQFVLDHVLLDRSDGEVGRSKSTLMIAALAVIVVSTVRAIVEYVRSVSFAWIGNQMVAQLRHRVFVHLQSLSSTFHAGARPGDLTVRLIGDLNMVRDVAVTALMPLLASIMMVAGMLVVMLLLNWKLALMAMSVLPLFWISANSSSRKIHAAAKVQRAREGILAATANESLSSMRVVQALSLEGVFADSFGVQGKKSMKDGVKTSRLSAALERKVDVIVATATALVLWRGAVYVLDGELTIGGLVVYLAYLKRGFKPMKDFAKYTGRISKALAAVDRISDILDQSPEVQDSSAAVSAPEFNGKIEFEDISFEYAPGQAVLDGFSLTVPAGQCVAVVGHSGAGKSTLLNLLCRLHEPTAGRILVDGQDIRQWTINSYRDQLRIVMQDNAVFAATVRENIALGERDANDEQVRNAAAVAGAHGFIEKLPEGYETMLGERGANLSRGQIQRIAIARASVTPGSILLVDEPTTGLDEVNERLVADGILRSGNGRTTLMVTHQLSLAKRADRIVVLQEGKIVECGSHDSLMNLEGCYASMYRSQQGSDLETPNAVA